MKTIWRKVGSLGLLVWIFLSLDTATAQSTNVDRSGLALEGYDPVSYFDSDTPSKGDEGISMEVDGVRYLFASEANREKFEANPSMYEPAFGGWCAWAMLDGDKVEVDPLSYRVFEGTLLVFYKGFFADTKAKWEKKSAVETETKLYEKAAANWKAIVNKSTM